MVAFTDMDLAAEEGANSQHYCVCAKLKPHLGNNAAHAVALAITVDNQVINRLLKNGKIRLVFQRLSNSGLVQNTVCLGPGSAHRRSLASVQNAELNTAAVSCLCHDATHGIDLFHQMALADTADRRVAAHLPQGLDVVR